MKHSAHDSIMDLTNEPYDLCLYVMYNAKDMTHKLLVSKIRNILCEKTLCRTISAI